jgi:predicted O-methyltransferase YrrM
MMTKEPTKTRWLRRLWRLTGRRHKLDRFFTSFLTYRKFLPECDAADVIPRLQESEIRIKQCPMGTWSTPMIDVITVLKAAVGFGSKQILELGSYRGDTARLLAENTTPETIITAVDIDERHGASYRGLDIEKKIRRKVGRITRDFFSERERFDLIFVDADHDLKSVMNDTDVAFDVLTSAGVILWHDYVHETYFHGMGGVPEALDEFAKRYPIYAIRGTTIGIYSSMPGWETARLNREQKNKQATSVWDEGGLRG